MDTDVINTELARRYITKRHLTELEPYIEKSSLIIQPNGVFNYIVDRSNGSDVTIGRISKHTANTLKGGIVHSLILDIYPDNFTDNNKKELNKLLDIIEIDRVK